MADSSDFGSLSIVSADGTRTEMRLSGPVLTIGRDPSNALVLPEASVSRFHGRLEWRGDRFWIVDQQSTCGTWVNRAQVREYPISESDYLVIGESQLTWRATKQGGSSGRCYACSSPLEPGSAFCDSCGARADISPTPSPVPSPPPRPPEPAPPPLPVPRATPSPPPQPAVPARPPADAPFLPPAVPLFPGPAPVAPPISQLPTSPPMPVAESWIGAAPAEASGKPAPPPASLSGPSQPPVPSVTAPPGQEARAGAPPDYASGKPFEPPQAIGRVLETFTLPPGQGEASFDSTSNLSLFLGPVGCGCLPTLLMFFGIGMMALNDTYRGYNLDMVAWSVPLGIMLVYAILRYLSCRTVAWLGEHGAAVWHSYPLTTPTCHVLLFAQAADLVKQQIHTTFTRNGTQTGFRDDLHLRWMDGAGRELLHLYSYPEITPWMTEKHRFAEAVDKAWLEHLLPLAEQKLAQEGSLTFPVYELVGLTVRAQRTNQVLRVRSGVLERCVDGRAEQTFQSAVMSNGQLILTDSQNQKWQKPAYAIANLALFILVSEQIAGVRWPS